MKKAKKKSLIGAVSLSILMGNMAPYVVSANEVIKPTLIATPNPTENFIQLDWGMSDKSQPYSYQIKQIKEGSSEPQSIQAKENVRVLNIYPPMMVGSPSDITYTTWNGETRTLPKSASLETWMETPNAENPKGYGMGLIDVDNATLESFKANPDSLLKDSNGEYKYDVVFFGTWDCNGVCGEGGDLNQASVDALKPFIESGRGALFGHDTLLYQSANHPYFAQLRGYLNMELGGFDTPTMGSHSSTYVQITKKGLLTNYPWSIGEVGTVLNVPSTHISGQLPKGDVWMRFTDASGNPVGSEVKDPETGLGTSNAFLSSYNNTAYIQTGHSNAEATADEQKIIANTLFYLSQITTETSWADRSGQDLEAPNTPTIQNASYNKQTGNLQFSYQSVVDNGSEYTYQVESTGQNNGVKTLSDPVTTTITSGLKGYSITVDTNPNTRPDTTIETTNSNYAVTQNFGQNFYIHVGAVDNQGNMSVAHYEVDITAPEQPILTATPSSPTNGNVSVVASYPSSATSKKLAIGDWIKGKADTSNRGIYIRGTGLNRNANRILEVNGQTIYDQNGGRGHRLTVLDKATLSVLEDLTYDTYGDVNAREALATKLNSLGSNVVVVISSFDAINLTTNLQNAFANVGGSGNYFEYRTPHVIIGSPGLGKGNGIEVYTSTELTADYAEATVKVTEDGKITGAWYDYTSPVLVKENGVKVSAKGIDSSGNVSAISSYTVNNIDRKAPTFQSIKQDITSYTAEPVTITATGTDGEYGVKRMYKPDTNIRGLKGTYYSHPSVVEAPSTIGSKLVERIDTHIDFDLTSGSFGSGLPTDFFTVEWEGLVYAPETGTYQFQTTSDDGVQLSINNQLIIDKWVQQSPTSYQGSVTLEGGKWYPIKMRYYESHGGAGVELAWKYGSKSAFEIISTDNFSPLGESVEGNSINKTVTENGNNHIFVVEDYAGNRTVSQAYAVSNIAPEYASELVSEDIPTVMEAGQTYTVTVKVKNVGREVWTEEDFIRLGTVNDTDPFYVDETFLTPDSNRVKTEGTVGFGEIATYQFKMKAPTQTGSYTTDWAMLQERHTTPDGFQAGHWYPTKLIDKAVQVIDTVAPEKATLTASTTNPTNEDVSVSVSYPSDASVKQYKIGTNGTWTAYTTPVVLNSNNTVFARSIDADGNVSAESSLVVGNIDKVAPSVPTISADKTTATNQNVTVSVSFPSDAVVKEYSTNGGSTWITYTNPVTYTANGTLQARAKDSAGNVSPVASYSVTNIDKVAPITPSILADITTPTNKNVVLTASFPSDAFVKEYRLNGGAWTTYSSPITMTANGKLEVRTTDNAGNLSAIGLYDVTNIDKVAPVNATLSASTTAPTNADVSVTINYPVDASVKQFKVGSTGSWTTYTAPVVLNANETVYARSYDSVGNVSAETSLTISNIDKVAPTTPSLVADKTAMTNTDVKVTVSYSSDSVTKEVRVNGGEWTSYTTPIMMTVNGKVEARAKDVAGNYSAIGSYSVTNIDKINPVNPSFVSSTTAPTNQDVSVTINFPSDAITKQYKIGTTGTWTNYTSPIILSANNTVYARAYDEAGNSSNEVTFDVKNIDKVAPNQPNVSADVTKATNANVVVNATYPADAVSKQYRVNGGTWTAYSVPVTFAENGTFEARAIDESGNVSTIASYTISNIDKVAPTTPSLTADKTNPTNTDVTITATFPSDAHVKEVRINGGSWTVYTTPITMSANGKVEVRATDNAGNLSAIASYNVSNIDKVAPVNPSILANITELTNRDVITTISYPSDASVKEYRIDGGTWIAYTSPLTFTKNGKVEARAKDVTGNVSEIVTYYVNNIDKIKPVIPTLTASETSPTNQNVVVNAQFVNDVVNKEMNVNGEGWKAYSPITFESNGFVQIRGWDQAGNVSDVARYDVENIDKVAPEQPSQSVKENQNTFTMSGESSTDSFYRLNDGAWVKYTEQVTLADGQFTISFKSVDKAGNESEVVTSTVTMYRDALAVAVTEVEKAEKEPVQENVDTAKGKVNAIPHNAPEYQPLMARLNDLQALIDAQKAIEKAIETRNEEDLALAKEKVDLLNNNNPIIIDLLDEVETSFEEANILALVAKERFDLLSRDYGVSREAYNGLVQIYYAIKYTGDNMYKLANEKVALVPVEDKHYEFVQLQMQKLQEDYNQFVDDRVDTDAEIKAESSLQVMERNYDPSYAVNTQNLINAVEDEMVRTSMQARLDNAKAKYESSQLDKASQDAIASVVKAETTKQTYYVTEAYKKVNSLINETLKTELTNRLQALESQMALERKISDATRTVELAEQYKYDSYINSAQTKVSALPDGEVKTSLQQRIDVLKSGQVSGEQATIIKQATNYVSLAYSIKTQYYVDKAQSYINQIIDPVKKAELQTKLDSIVVK